jgi:hypothetical protein
VLEKLDGFLGALSAFDWITPLITLVQNAHHGPHFCFRVPHKAGWGIYSVKGVLSKAGCDPVWGLQIIGDVMLLHVRRADAQRGYWAMHNAGVPMENGVPKTGRK